MNKTNFYKHYSKAMFIFLYVCLLLKQFYKSSAHLLHAVFLWSFIKWKGYPVAQKFDVIEKSRGHFLIQRPKVSQKQVSDLSQQKLCSPVESISFCDYYK